MSKKRSLFNDGYLNSQKYLECQLVTIINAAIHLGEQPVSPDSEEYERIVDIGCARYGAAIRPEYVMDYLRIEAFNTDPCWENLQRNIYAGFPVEYGVHHPKVGFHSVLVIGCTEYDKKRVRVANLSQDTDAKMWMDWDKFKELWYFISNWEARYFRLKTERELFYMQKCMSRLGYPPSWFHSSHRGLKGKTPITLLMSGRVGIQIIRKEVEKRREWTQKRREREIQKLNLNDLKKT